MEEHRKECPLEMIQCEYYSVGCKCVKLARKDAEEHKKEKIEEHLMMTKSELINTKAQLSIAMKQINNLTVLMNAHLSRGTRVADFWTIHLDTIATMVELGNQVCPVTIKMPHFTEKCIEKKKWCTDPFYTHNKGYKMCLCVNTAGVRDSVGTHLSVYLFLMKGPHDDELTWPLRGKFEIKLFNQIKDRHHHLLTIRYCEKCPSNTTSRVTTSKYSRGWGNSHFITNKHLYQQTTSRQFLKNDCLFFQVTKI